MADMAAQPSAEAAVQAEDDAYYHESALNAAWTGSRLAIGGLTFLFGCFVFTYFYLRSLNSSGLWQGPGFVRPSLWMGTTIMLLAVVSACAHYYGLARIKAGHKRVWQLFGLIALGLGLAAVAFQIYQLTDQLAVLVWLETLLARSRFIPAMSFVEQPPTITDTQTVQRFQASLSAFATMWTYLALIALLFWFLFYAL